jgi:peptidyl-prolyl cis-trans isomerase C
MTGAIMLGVLALSCGRDDPAGSARTADENAALGGEVAARVGTQAIPLAVVASVAEAQKLNARDAARKVVDDEIAAIAARARGLDRSQPAAWRLVSARARFTSDRLFEEAKQQGLPNDAEVTSLSERHWVEVDRPPTVRVVHAIVLRPKDPTLLEQARALAADLRAAVAPATSDEDFKKKAEAVPRLPRLDVKVEQLPAFTSEGRVTEGPGQMDAIFAKAAFALAQPGETSRVVETGFGLHVIRLVESLPEQRMPFETRRLAFAAEVYSLRARDLLQARLRALGGTREIVVSASAEELMRSVVVSAPSSGEGTP